MASQVRFRRVVSRSHIGRGVDSERPVPRSGQVLRPLTRIRSECSYEVALGRLLARLGVLHALF